jgi:hypothetical protein
MFRLVEEQLYLVGSAAVGAAAEQFEPVRFNGEATATRGLRRHGVDAAILYLCDCPTRHADQMVVMGWLARHVGMPAIWQVNALNESLLGEQVEEAEDRGPANAEASLTRIGDEVGRREVPVALGNERRNLTARTGKADPRLV